MARQAGERRHLHRRAGGHVRSPQNGQIRLRQGALGRQDQNVIPADAFLTQQPANPFNGEGRLAAAEWSCQKLC